MNTTRDNAGALFINQRREQDTHPDRTGKAKINGVDYFVNAWTKQGQNGPFISLSFKKMEPRGGGEMAVGK